jgi:hypothetical protein
MIPLLFLVAAAMHGRLVVAQSALGPLTMNPLPRPRIYVA